MTTAASIVHRPRQSDDGRTVTASIELGGHTHEVFYHATDGPISTLSDPFVALALLPAMKLGATLRVEGDTSALLMQNLDTLQDVYHKWYGDLQHIVVEATITPAGPMGTGRGRGCLFRGDVASFYTVFTNRPAMTHVVVTPGLDVPAAAAPALAQAAAELGMAVVTVQTNAREMLDARLDWQAQSRGAARAGVAHLLAPQLSHVYMPGEMPYYRLVAAGVHPFTDRHWSSDGVRLIHDGAEATPWQKAQRVLRETVAQRYLRVCRKDNAGNCGVCTDCLAMMGFLRATGRTGYVATLPPLADLDLLRAMDLSTATERAAIDELRLLLADEGGAPDVIAALDDCLNRYEAPEHILPWTMRVRAAQAELFAAQDELQAARSSLSWRLTRPVRWLGSVARGRLHGR